jgi:hypothetical protein
VFRLEPTQGSGYLPFQEVGPANICQLLMEARELSWEIRNVPEREFPASTNVLDEEEGEVAVRVVTLEPTF